MSTIDFNHFGKVTAGGLFVNVTVTILGIGIQLFMCIYGLACYLESPRTMRRGKPPYIIVSFVILGLFSLTAAMDAYTNFRSLFEATTGREFYILTQEFEREWFRILSIFSLMFSLFTSDGLLLYRCYIVWKDQWYVLVIPGLCYLSTIGLGLQIAAPSQNWTPQDRIIGSAFTFLSVILNIMITSLLSFRLLRARNSMLGVLPSKHIQIYSRLIIILVEAALPVAVFGIGYAITLVIPLGETTAQISNWQISNMFFSTLYFLFATLSPQMIIFRVTTGRSWTDTTNASDNSTNTVLSTKNSMPVFAAGQDSSQWPSTTGTRDGYI
ncbi:hypothetical protein FA15DRAFT_760394 [Coprinopsis marcescibilis]|uniref:Uncharacterized protein n=1 Tax=Coprinopsis marcescibilis TaxID=230819 RepID=A0A5C3KG31_COPMA|nr:hypothetical protein FA15DRAFT_760394 [Coprinopsis marcescibilis]